MSKAPSVFSNTVYTSGAVAPQATSCVIISPVQNTGTQALTVISNQENHSGALVSQAPSVYNTPAQNLGTQALNFNTNPVQNSRALTPQAPSVYNSPLQHSGAVVPQTPSVFSPVQNTGTQALTVNTSPVQNTGEAVNTCQDQHIFYQQNVVTPTGQVLYQMTFPASGLPADNQLAPAAAAPPPASYNQPTNKRITSAGTFVPTFTAVSYNQLIKLGWFRLG